ncbi:GtrA family protein [Romboutsia lituseburensis]|uniref:GtrA family protein n=1 Tax=Romboutsia lituseburensis TaxID=1537 RepID=UPI00215B4B9D|nr:GtrA family protein [Romboutsia lituseburensis]MCR8745449.1 GtrA family protein [Romboutsia lituseburensis]
MNYLSKLKSNTKAFEFIKFVIVGGLATAIHYAIYFILQVIKLQYNLAYTIGYILSFIFNFFASNYFTFNTKPSLNRGFRFFIAHAFNYSLQLILLNVYINIGINRIIAPIFIFMISVPINFLVVKFALKLKPLNTNI